MTWQEHLAERERDPNERFPAGTRVTVQGVVQRRTREGLAVQLADGRLVYLRDEHVARVEPAAVEAPPPAASAEGRRRGRARGGG